MSLDELMSLDPLQLTQNEAMQSNRIAILRELRAQADLLRQRKAAGKQLRRRKPRKQPQPPADSSSEA